MRWEGTGAKVQFKNFVRGIPGQGLSAIISSWGPEIIGVPGESHACSASFDKFDNGIGFDGIRIVVIIRLMVGISVAWISLPTGYNIKKVDNLLL